MMDVDGSGDLRVEEICAALHEAKHHEAKKSKAAKRASQQSPTSSPSALQSSQSSICTDNVKAMVKTDEACPPPAACAQESSKTSLATATGESEVPASSPSNPLADESEGSDLKADVPQEDIEICDVRLSSVIFGSPEKRANGAV
eukprot:gnl/MRDRNA2_/MRDRNA2_147473_c1_seq1.p1 gnl/MRDRNA2_/MRDRNA2_147473_c1~~gnl/MRDRNA2_/MRDRNA2_147473_c1_seq1.p1  ORF type:complete len:145 (+),score=26.65 gnl/MRDRNA2_/MRDRNA2_147473_c1_seq1:228-662(+)